MPHSLQQLSAIYRDGLLNDTLPFWLRHCLDHEFGGYRMALAADGSVVDSDKGVWQQGRFAWLLSKLFNTVEQNPEWLEAAKLGIEFLESHCFDPDDGRMWFHVTREGQPIRKRRYAFSESFAAIAFAQYARATGEEAYARKAEQLFHAFVQHNLHPPSSLAKFTGTRPCQSIGFPMITMVTAQELREAIGFAEADKWIDFSVDKIAADYVDDDHQVVLETVGIDGGRIEHFDGRTLNPGHAIEASWFIMWEGFLRQDSRLVEIGEKMLRWMWHRGWDRQFGGMLYFVDVHDHDQTCDRVQEYWHDMKFWWPHNETIIATLMAYLLTGKDEYRGWHQQVHDWSYEHFSDKQHGEWFGYLARDGRITSRLKGNLWKGPFHFPRMQLVCWQAIEKIAENN